MVDEIPELSFLFAEAQGLIGYDMVDVRALFWRCSLRLLLTREGERCDLQVICEIFGRQCYLVADAAAAAAAKSFSAQWQLTS